MQLLRTPNDGDACQDDSGKEYDARCRKTRLHEIF